MVVGQLISSLGSYGYLGVFLATLASSATVIVPLPLQFFAIPAVSTVLNPFWVGIAAGLGTAIGETTSYLIGLGGRKLATEKYSRDIKKLEKLFAKYRPFWAILIFGVLPFPFDIIGLFCGVIKYDFRGFFLATSISKVLRFWAIAYAGPVTEFLFGTWGWEGVAVGLVIATIAVIAAWRHFEKDQ